VLALTPSPSPTERERGVEYVGHGMPCPYIFVRERGAGG